MKSILPLSIGAAASGLLYREHELRGGAERLSAATLETLLNAIDANDSETGAHVRRVAAYALVLADALQLAEHQTKIAEGLAPFHGTGKIPEALFDIIHEHSHLTSAERRAIATHPRRG